MKDRWNLSWVIAWGLCWAAPQAAAAIVYLEANLTPEQVIPKNGAASPAGVSNASAVATMVFDTDLINPRMEYEIVFSNISLEHDVQAIHFHLGHALGASESEVTVDHGGGGPANGPHVLNVYGPPRQDDADLVIDFSNNRVRGVWDNLDRNYGPDGLYDPSDSVGVGTALLEILAGDIYIQVHSYAYPVPDTGELRGTVLQVPEPERMMLMGLTALWLLMGRRRVREAG